MNRIHHVFSSVAVLFNTYAFNKFKDESPYMDEIFHIPQAQKYCENNFSDWDPKITTFPGLYTLSAAIHSLTGLPCSGEFLRAVNFVLSFLVLLLLQQCRKIALRKKESDHIPVLLFLFPTISLYYILFYTDTASLVSILLCYWHSRYSLISPVVIQKVQQLKKNRVAVYSQRKMGAAITSLMFACVSVYMRQTNAIWLLFIAGSLMLEELVRLEKFYDRDITGRNIVSFVLALWKEKTYLLKITWPYLLPVLGFIYFVYKNGSVVLGDKENHSVTLHYIMLPHLFLVYFFIMLPRYVSTLIGMLSLVENGEKRSVWIWFQMKFFRLDTLSIALFTILAVIFGFQTHPFILSDNRHYTFYLHQRVFQYLAIRCLLAPLYALAAITVYYDILYTKKGLWMLIWLLASSLTLLPTPLLEPRYFTLPLVMLALHSSDKSNTSGLGYIEKIGALVQLVGVLCAHISVLYIFVYRPFIGADQNVARFMF